MEKKSFIIYKDNAPIIRRLPKEEVGELLLLLLDYAQEGGEEETPQEFLQGREVSMPVELVFGFVAGSIYRDNQVWRRTKAAREARKARQEEPRPASPWDKDIGTGKREELDSFAAVDTLDLSAYGKPLYGDGPYDRDLYLQKRFGQLPKNSDGW